jgi:hypothetical protein
VACSASALVPRPYGVRGGYPATFATTVLESAWTAGWDGRPTGTLTECTDTGARETDLPPQLTCRGDRPRPRLPGRPGTSRLTPAGVQLTLDVRTLLARCHQPSWTGLDVPYAQLGRCRAGDDEVVTRPSCELCGAPLLLSTNFDAAFCPDCDAWREPACADTSYAFCTGRPDHPSGAAHLGADDVWSEP